MEQDDIEQVETYLMEKHGILSTKEKVDYIARENSNRSEPIPLRVLANHPTVVWQRVSQITGVPMRISRIGAKKSNGSSDW
jgi:hypothetical protein